MSRSAGRRSAHRTAALAAPVLLVLATVGCKSGTGIVNFDAAFIQEAKVQITHPDAGARVSLPVTIMWDVGRDLPTGTQFLVLVDDSPMRPRNSLSGWLRGRDRNCLAPRCPDDPYLERHNIHLTEEQSLTMKVLPAGVRRTGGKEYHTVTLVLLDADQRRIGEHFSSVDFSVDRHD